MAISARLDQPVPADGQRSAARRALKLETSGVIPGGGAANVTVHNISASGLLLETALDLAPGEELAIELPEAGTSNASIIWRSGRLYGCAFARPISTASLAAAQLQGVAVTPDPAPLSQAPLLGASGRDALGSRLNRLRREAGLTLADVAAALGVSKPTVWAWEKGKARPLPERLDKIASALGVSRDALASAGGESGDVGAVIAECRTRISEACGTEPAAVRIMIEL
jgi:transcriptional regulator with XRE-family HTH domain